MEMMTSGSQQPFLSALNVFQCTFLTTSANGSSSSNTSTIGTHWFSEVTTLAISASNRFDAEMASVVTSLNQWVPMVLVFDEDEPFAEVVKKVHWKTFNALKNGCCDPDVIISMREEFGQLDPPVDPGYNYN